MDNGMRAGMLQRLIPWHHPAWLVCTRAHFKMYLLLNCTDPVTSSCSAGPGPGSLKLHNGMLQCLVSWHHPALFALHNSWPYSRTLWPQWLHWSFHSRNVKALLLSAFKVPFYLAGVLLLGIYGTALARNIGETYGGACFRLVYRWVDTATGICHGVVTGGALNSANGFNAGPAVLEAVG